MHGLVLDNLIIKGSHAQKSVKASEDFPVTIPLMQHRGCSFITATVSQKGGFTLQTWGGTTGSDVGQSELRHMPSMYSTGRQLDAGRITEVHNRRNPSRLSLTARSSSYRCFTPLPLMQIA